jgi:lipopolysaccharide transport system permease protein
LPTQLCPPIPLTAALDQPRHAEQRHVRLTPSSRWALPRLGELWHYRELLVTLARRDLKLRYKQTALGMVWVVFPPLFAAAIFTYIRGFFGLPAVDQAPEILFVLTGFVVFTLFREIFDRSSASLLANQHLVGKIYFPRTLLPLATTLSVLFDHAILLLTIAGAWIVCGVVYGSDQPDVIVPTPGMSLLWWPVMTLVAVLMAVGSGMIIAALSSHYRDFKHVVPVVLQLLVFASPVFWDLRLAFERDNGWLILLNPLSGLIAGYRWSILGIGTMHWPAFAYSAGYAILVFLGGLFAFRRVEGRLADVI